MVKSTGQPTPPAAPAPTGNTVSKRWYHVDISLSLTLLIPAIITVLGWYFANNLEAQRDRENKLRDIKIQFDIDAYNDINLALQRSWSRDTNVYRQLYIPLDAALLKIQLAGTESQIQAAQDIMDSFSARKIFVDGDPIINSLRDDLRNELNLPPTTTKVRHVSNVPGN